LRARPEFPAISSFFEWPIIFFNLRSGNLNLAGLQVALRLSRIFSGWIIWSARSTEGNPAMLEKSGHFPKIP
jgi:hypothetical protein